MGGNELALGQRCRACGAVQFPLRTLCRICRHRKLEALPLSGRGYVHSLTPHGPHSAVAWIELEEGPLVRGHVTGDLPHGVFVGLPVALLTRQERLRLRSDGQGYAFRPIGRATRESLDIVPGRGARSGFVRRSDAWASRRPSPWTRTSLASDATHEAPGTRARGC